MRNHQADPRLPPPRPEQSDKHCQVPDGSYHEQDAVDDYHRQPVAVQSGRDKSSRIADVRSHFRIVVGHSDDGVRNIAPKHR